MRCRLGTALVGEASSPGRSALASTFTGIQCRELSRIAARIRRSVKARYRLVRRKFRATKRRVVIRVLLFTLKARYQMLMKGRIALAFCGRRLATIAGLFLAAVFIVTLPQNMFAS